MRAGPAAAGEEREGVERRQWENRVLAQDKKAVRALLVTVRAASCQIVRSTGQTAPGALLNRLLPHSPTPASAVPVRSNDVGSGTGTPGKVLSGPVPNEKTTPVIGVVAKTFGVVRTNVPVP